MIAITGASGLLGSNLAIALLERGEKVRAIKRKSSRVDHLARFDIEWVDGDLDDTAALARAFEGCDVVYHCAAQVSIMKNVTPALVRANVDGTRHVLEAAKDVRRVVHCSSTVTIGLSEDGKPCTEEATWNFDKYGLADGYVTTKRMAEDLVREEIEHGRDIVIANPGYMIGPYDVRPSSGRLVQAIVQGKMPGRTPGFNDFVDVRDVARGMILVAEKGKRGERYILSGHAMSYGDFADRVAKIAGVKAPTWNVPRVLATMLGWIGDVQEAITGNDPFINTSSARFGYCKTFIFSSEKAMRELGYTIGPIDDAIRDCIAWFREHGIL